MPTTKLVWHPVAEEHEQMVDAGGTKRSDIKCRREDTTATGLADIESNAQSGGRPLENLLQSIRGRRYAHSRPPKDYIQRVWSPCCICEHPLYSSFWNVRMKSAKTVAQSNFQCCQAPLLG